MPVRSDGYGIRRGGARVQWTGRRKFAVGFLILGLLVSAFSLVMLVMS